MKNTTKLGCAAIFLLSVSSAGHMFAQTTPATKTPTATTNAPGQSAGDHSATHDQAMTMQKSGTPKGMDMDAAEMNMSAMEKTMKACDMDMKAMDDQMDKMDAGMGNKSMPMDMDKGMEMDKGGHM